MNCVEIKLENGKIVNIPGSEFKIKAELVLIAAGFLSPEPEGLIKELVDLGLELDNRGNVKAEFGDDEDAHITSIPKLFACGDMRRGQSLIVWAIAEGRKCAASVHRHLTELISEENLI